LHSQALVLGGLQPLYLFERTIQYGSRRFLESVDDSFLIQMLKEPTRKGGLLDLILANKAELIVDVEAGGRLGCTDHEMMQFRILSEGSRAKSRTTTLNLRRADFGHSKNLPGRILGDTALERRGM